MEINMNQFNRIFLLGILFTLLLSACGIKGPLYIPEKKYPPKTSFHMNGPVAYSLFNQLTQA
jgi:predicted small lipoprotein YifL